MQNNTDQESSFGRAKSKPEVIKLGLDLHARQVTAGHRVPGTGRFDAQTGTEMRSVEVVRSSPTVDRGIKVYSCYEAGASGYWGQSLHGDRVAVAEQSLREALAFTGGRLVARTDGPITPWRSVRITAGL